MVVACQTMMFKHQIQRTLNIFVLPRRLALTINDVSHCLQLRKSTIYGRRILHILYIYFEQTHRMLRMFTLIRYCKQALMPYICLAELLIVYINITVSDLSMQS